MIVGGFLLNAGFVALFYACFIGVILWFSPAARRWLGKIAPTIYLAVMAFLAVSIVILALLAALLQQLENAIHAH